MQDPSSKSFCNTKFYRQACHANYNEKFIHFNQNYNNITAILSGLTAWATS